MKCEKCNKEHDGTFGSGRFCSRSCANSRKHSEKTRTKISETLRQAKSSTKKYKVNKKLLMIEKGKQLAKEINLSNSPYSEYNTAFRYTLVGNRDCYKLCLYINNKRIKYEVILVYRFIVAQSIGRKLKENEVVHHIDGNCLNNDLNNLVIMTRNEHSRHHAVELNTADRIKKYGGWNKGLKMSDEVKR